MWIETGCLRCRGDLSLVKDEDGEAWKCFQCGARLDRKKGDGSMKERMAPLARRAYLEDHKSGIVASLYLLGWYAGAAEWGISDSTMHRLRYRWTDVNWKRVWRNKPGRVKKVPESKPEKTLTAVTENRDYARGYRQCILDIMTISKAKLEKLGGE